MNKIVLRKTTSVIFLIIVLVLGAIALTFPSSMINAQAQSNYDGMANNNDRNSYENDNHYYSYYKSQKDSNSKKSVNINKIICINTNLNINGNNAGDINIGNKGQGYLGAYGSDGNGGEGHSKLEKGSDCVINNNNNNFQTISSELSKSTLNVIKNVTCTYTSGLVNPVFACLQLEERITENQFLIEVTDDNPVPSQFPGSESGTIVTLGAGNYIVSETPDFASLEEEIQDLEDEFKSQSGAEYDITGPSTSFTGDCTDINPNNLELREATGTIGAGESQICEIENHFDIRASIE